MIRKRELKHKKIFHPRSSVAASRPLLFSKSKKKQTGQALLEYALLLAMAATLSLGFVSSFGGFISSGMLRFNAVLEKELKTCNFNGDDASWEN